MRARLDEGISRRKGWERTEREGDWRIGYLYLVCHGFDPLSLIKRRRQGSLWDTLLSRGESEQRSEVGRASTTSVGAWKIHSTGGV